MLWKVWWKILLGLILAAVVGILVLLNQVGITPGILKSSLFGQGIETPDNAEVRSSLSVPDGFSIGLYAANVTNARFIEFSERGDLIVAQPRQNQVMLLARDADNNGSADSRRVLFDNLNRPHSIDFHDGYLYIAESDAVGRVPFDHETGTLTGDYKRIITGLGDEGNHWTKTLRFGPDGLLYLSSGSTCNVCEESDEQRATITRYQPDGSGEERFATGLRNSVGFDWAAFDNTMYATDNGRDLLGDDYPPCELNKVEAGGFYGWPYVNGFGDLDPDFGDETKLAESTSPVHGFRAHNAPLGIRFIDSPAFPVEYQDAALVALHGSWNRSTYDGYSVVSLHRQEDGSFEERNFVSGFETDGEILGRPVDVAQGPDHCVYVSDDYAMAIYRVCYGEQQTSTVAASDLAASGTTKTETGLEAFSADRLSELTSRGEAIYRSSGCTGCHKVSGSDDPRPGLKVLADLTARYTVTSLNAFYKTPTPPMPPVNLNEDDSLALSTYLLQLD